MFNIIKVSVAIILLGFVSTIFWVITSDPLGEKIAEINELLKPGQLTSDSLKNRLSVIVEDAAGSDTDTLYVANSRRTFIEPLQIRKNMVDVSGYSEPADRIILKINNRDLREIYPEPNGRFSEPGVALARGYNTLRLLQIVQRDTVDTIMYVIKVKGEPVPFQLLGSQYDSRKQRVNLVGVGEPDSLRYVGDSSVYIITGMRGTFEAEVNKFSIKSDSVANRLAKFSNREWANWMGMANGTLARKIEFSVDSLRERVTAKFTTRLPTNSLLVDNFTNDVISWQDFIGEVFGHLDHQWRLRSTRQTSDSTGVTLFVHELSRALDPEMSEQIELYAGTHLSRWPMMSPSDTIVLNVPRSLFYSLSHSPTSTVGDTRIFVGPKPVLSGVAFSFRLPFIIAPPVNSEKETVRPLPKNLITLIREFPDKLFNIKAIFNFRSLLWAFSSCIPLVLLLFLVRQYPNQFEGQYDNLRNAAMVFVFLNLGPAAFNVANDISDLAYAAIRPTIMDWTGPYHYFNFYVPFYYFSCFCVLLCYPIAKRLLAWGDGEERDWVSTWARWFLIVLVAVGCAYLQLSYYEMELGLVLSTGAVVMFFLSGLLLRSIVKNGLQINFRYHHCLELMGCLLIIPLFLDAIRRGIGNNAVTIISIILSTLFGILFLYTIVRILLKLVPGGDAWIQKKNNRIVLAVLLFTTALPKAMFFEPLNVYSGLYSVDFLLDTVKGYFPLMVLTSIIYVMHKRGATTKSSLSQLDLNLAFFLVPVYVIGLRYYYMFLPITMVLGFFLCRWLMFETKNIATVSPALSSDRRGELEKILAYIDFKKRFKGIRQNLDRNLENGTIAIDEWRKKVEENAANLAKAKANAEMNGTSLQKIVFSQGLEATRWANATVSLKVGCLLAIPWVYMQLRELRLANIGNLYPLLSAMSELLYGVVVWIILALVFGYYFENLRGRTGMEKAFWLALIIVVSALAPGILFTDSFTQAAGLMIWCLKVFTYLTLLGFTIDLKVFQKAGFGWREIETTYNLAFLSTYGSTLVAALVGILSGRLETLFGTVLKGLFG